VKVPLPVRTVPALSFEAWLTPPPLGRSTAQRDRVALSEFSHCHFGGVPGFEIGSGPLALAIHGWGGRPAQLAPMALRLAEEGFRIVVPNLPGHAGGEKTDIVIAAGAVKSLIDDLGQPELIVAHSFASMVMRLVFPEDAPGGIVLVAPALDVNDALDVFGDRLRLLPWARRGLRSRLEAWDPSLWPVLSALHPEQLPGADVLIVHDPADEDTSFARSAELAAIRPATSIVPIDGVGHTRILSDPHTLEVVADFVSNHRVSSHNAA
jgi:pimeloyl-ACP methyl ester carboxylesterase